MSDHDMRQIIRFFSEYGFLIGLGVAVVITLIVGLVLRRPKDKGAGKGKGGEKGKKGKAGAKGVPGTPDGKGGTYQDDGLTSLEEEDGAEYFDDSKF